MAEYADHCQTPECAMNGVVISGLDTIPADMLPVTCGECGNPFLPVDDVEIGGGPADAVEL